MTILERLAMLAFFAAVIIGVDLPSIRAEPAPPVAAAAKPGATSAKPPGVVVEAAKPAKQPVAKQKPRSRATAKSAKPASATAVKPAQAAAKPAAAPAAKPNQVMDFDTDDVEGKRLEPGYELIQAGPRRARQQSMVPYPPKPEDSVVRGE